VPLDISDLVSDQEMRDGRTTPSQTGLTSVTVQSRLHVVLYHK